MTSGCGTVFELTPSDSGTGGWQAVVLHAFQAGSDGAYRTSLIRSDWKLYGTTNNGGGSMVCPYGGCGTVFELMPSTRGEAWTERILYAFQGSSGGGSTISLVEMNGVLYGLTSSYAATVFQLTPPVSGDSSKLSVLYNFAGGADGETPNTLLAGSARSLYGTTLGGGTVSAACGGASCGTIFQLNPPASAGAWKEDAASVPGWRGRMVSRQPHPRTAPHPLRRHILRRQFRAVRKQRSDRLRDCFSVRTVKRRRFDSTTRARSGYGCERCLAGFCGG